MQFMSSGPTHILVLSQVEDSDSVIPAWREFIGPADIEEARRDKPERLVNRIKKKTSRDKVCYYESSCL